MKIAFVVPWEESTPPKKYGGIELVAYNIIERLVAVGHNVVVLGTGDSKVSAELVPIFDKATRSMPYSSNALAREANTFLGISRAVEKLQWIDADLVHNHLGWRLLMFQKMIRQPIVSTIHLSLDDPYEQDIYKLVPTHPFVSISNSQRKNLPDLNYIENIYNGIDVDKFDFSGTHDGYLAFLGSFVKHKGPDKAIEIAKATGHKLILAGKVDPLQVDFFNNEIKPHIDNDQIVFIGEVDHTGKNELLRSAKALLMPISWDEPFGLVMTEAMACGTPVVAIRRGSTPEIIDHGVDGFLCDSVEEMSNCIQYIDQLDRAMCRKNVEDNFSTNRMVDGYLGVYSHVVSHHMSQPRPLNKFKKIKYKARQTFQLKTKPVKYKISASKNKAKASIKKAAKRTKKYTIKSK